MIPDTGLSRTAGGTVAVGNGTQGDASGAFRATNYQVTSSGQLAGLSSNGVAGVVAVGNGTSGDFTGTLKGASVALGGAGVSPLLTLTDPISARVWQLRVGASGTGAFDLFDFTDNKTLIWSGSSEVRIGTSTNIVQNTSRLFVFGGASGANVDVMGDGTVSDQAVVELEGSDYSTHANSIFMKFSGINGIGTTLGITNVNMGQLVCGGTCANMVIGSLGTTAPIIFTTNSLERMRLLNGYQLNLGVAGTGSGILGLNGSTSGTATITAPAVAGTLTNPFLFSNSLGLPSGTVYGWNSDTGLSRTVAGTIAAGNGVQGDISATFKALVFQAGKELVAVETTTPAQVSSQGILYTDSTTHRMRLSLNAGGFQDLVDIASTDTLTNKTLTSPTITSPSSTGTDSGTETLTNKTLTSPIVSTGISQGSGLKHQRFGTSCTTGATAGNTCTTAYSWTSAFADANYTAVCFGEAASGTNAIISINAKSASQLTVVLQTPANIAASYGTMDCIAMHD